MSSMNRSKTDSWILLLIILLTAAIIGMCVSCKKPKYDDLIHFKLIEGVSEDVDIYTNGTYQRYNHAEAGNEWTLPNLKGTYKITATNQKMVSIKFHGQVKDEGHGQATFVNE